MDVTEEALFPFIFFLDWIRCFTWHFLFTSLFILIINNVDPIEYIIDGSLHWFLTFFVEIWSAP